MKKVIAGIFVFSLAFSWSRADTTTIQWQTPNPGLDNALRDMSNTLIMDGMNWVIAMYIDDGAGGSTNMFNTTPAFGTTMDPFHPTLNPTGTDMIVPGTIKGNVATFVPGSYFELLSPAGDPPYDYSLIAGRQVYTVIYNTTDTNLLGATSFAIADNVPFNMPMQSIPPTPELPTVLYSFGTVSDFDWIQQAIPEPSTFTMLIAGMGFVMAMRRRKIA
ncbi:MAG: PEP-CTERM sorting domain-containing protein [Verrucomicrobiota bacterium]